MMPLLFEVMQTPARALQCDDTQWDALIRLCRRANVLGRLAAALAAQGLLDEVPPAPRQHLIAARVAGRRQSDAVRHEIERLQHALAPVGAPLVLLKGAAYLATGAPCGEGRLFSDIDILVPRARLDEVESALMLHGWHTLPMTDYDQRYYRRWMHELPPMQHRQTQALLDVHHTLLPPTAALTIDSARLFEHLQDTQLPGVQALSLTDQILHSACHWFFESEFPNGLRDALDMVSLVSSQLRHPAGWAQLVARAHVLGVSVPLSAALHQGATQLGLVLPDTACLPRPGRLASRMLRHALTPPHPLTDTLTSRTARALLYLRGHRLRMPAPLLARHLWHKAWARAKQMEPPQRGSV